MPTGNILVADDDAAIRTVLNQALARAGYEVRTTGQAATLWTWAAQGLGDLIITDVVMPDGNAFDLLPRIKRVRPELPIIVMSAQNTFMTAIKASERGAYEYLPKPFDLKELVAIVGRALSRPRGDSGRANAAEPDDIPLIGRSPAMQDVYRALARLMPIDLTVMINGESGTGKELVARALHDYGKRKNGPFVAINMAAIPKDLIESELFGHEKGAFTGALTRSSGRFEQAEGGTLFLDEIGDISPRTQVALLRVLQERTFERVGGTTPIHANVRVVCATHRNLAAMVERGEFREDLYYRLCGVVLEVPALRQRLGDLPDLARHLLERVALERGEAVRTLSRDAVELMARHKWQGNVRELENVLRSLSLFCEGTTITSSDLVAHHECFAELASRRAEVRAFPAPPPTLRESIPPELEAIDEDDAPLSTVVLPVGAEDPSSATEAAYAHVRGGKASLFDLKRQIERDCILLALKETGGNITRAATLLGMKRPRLSQLVKQYQLASEES